MRSPSTFPRWPSLVWSAIPIAALLGCGGVAGTPGVDAPGAPCLTGTDQDGDGYGAGCAAGDDCDDADPAIHAGCSCESGVASVGCPCSEPGRTATCYSGPPESLSYAPCTRGVATCSSGVWSRCNGEVAPQLEVCDQLDNDCDGEIDEGVLSPCGDCDSGCDTSGVGDDGPFPMPGDVLPPGVGDVDTDGVGLDPAGDLVLDGESIDYHFLWVANAGAGTVSKLDTQTGHEVARYASVTHASVVAPTGIAASTLPAMGGSNSPSRTAVDFFGNVWVANRAFGLQPSASKILNNVSECPDRDGDGIVETSSDVNGDGVIDPTNPAEFFGEADECIAFTVIIGQAGLSAGVLAAAIDAGIEPGDPGNAWIGMFSEQAFYQLDGRTGALLRRVAIPGNSPYGAAIDSVGRLWAIDRGSDLHLTAINTVTGAVIGDYLQPALGCNGAYGIAVDLADRVWLGGYSACGGALRFNPVDSTWAFVPVPGYHGSGWISRGIGADGLGNVWLALHTSDFASVPGAVARIDSNTLTATGAWDVVGAVPVGAAVDFDGNVWTVNQSTNNASRLTIDPVTHEPAANATTGNALDTFPVGAGPYTYSDFTGFGLRHITRPRGDYTVTIEGCPDGSPATWASVTFDADVPASTSVEVWVRAGDDLATLGALTAIGAWTTSPADLQAVPGPVPDSRYLQLIIRLLSMDRTTSPTVRSIDMQWSCPGVIVP